MKGANKIRPKNNLDEEKAQKVKREEKVERRVEGVGKFIKQFACQVGKDN